MARNTFHLAVRLVAVLVLVAFGLALVLWWMRPTLTEEQVRRSVITTIQAEAPASFYVTGTLDITATATVANTKYLFPELLRFDLGTTRATVRLPGRVAYGFDASQLHPDDIRFDEAGLIEVALPELRVFSVEPQLDSMEVQTDVGWARTYARSGQRVTQRATVFAQEALRKQGTSYLASATQPRVHTAEALQTLLTPVLQAAGVSAPRFRFRIGPHLVMEPAPMNTPEPPG